MDCSAINALPDRGSVDDAISKTLDHVDKSIAGSKAFIATFSGDTLKLVVLPEYFLTSFPMGESIAEWRTKDCREVDGAEYQRMGEIAKTRGVYLSGNAYELDPHFPDLYFQTSFIINDMGEVILRYRRLISMFAPTPHDVLSQYIEVYGADALFQFVVVGGRRWATYCKFLEEALRLLARFLQLRRAHGSERRQPGQHAGRHRRPDEDAYTYSGTISAHARDEGLRRVDCVHRLVRRGRELVGPRFELVDEFRDLVVGICCRSL